MKKPASLEQSQARQPRGRSAGKPPAPAIPATESVKPSQPRQEKPMALLEAHDSNDLETHALRFEYYNPAAKAVCVAGTFNNWQPAAAPLSKGRGGTWSTEFFIKPGRYEYRFVVDGQWQDDPMAARFVSNPFGGLNCVVEVQPMSARAAKQA